MPRNQAQLEQAAVEARAWLDSLDPDVTPAQDSSDLRAVAEAVEDVGAANQRLTDAVMAARASGRSWGRIAMALGTSRQSAQERYGQVARSTAG